MRHLLQSSRKKVYAVFAVLAAFILATVLILTNTGIGNNLFPGRATSPSEYSITLDSSNKVTSNGEKVQKTKRGNDVKFDYSGTNGSTSGHVTLSNGGSIVNTTEIRSIQSITATFSGSGTLKFKTAFGGDAWTGETVMESGYTYELGSDPYYVYFGASNNTVTISQIVITFGCYDNPEAAGHTVIDPAGTYYEKVTSTPTFSTKDKYLIVYEDGAVAFNGALSTLDANFNKIDVTFDEDVIQGNSETDAAVFTIDASGHIKSASGYYIGNTGNSNNLSSSTSTQYTNTITVTNGVAEIISSGSYFRYNSNSSNMRFRYYKSETYANQKAVALYKQVVVQGGSHTEYDTPEESLIGFTAQVSKSSYLHDEVFDESTLSVYAKFTGAKPNEAVSKGENGYSYVIKNSNNAVIDSTKAFGTPGTYKLIVSYKNFSPIEINLTVDFHLILTEIEVISSYTVFNTAQKLSDYTSGISVNLTYNDPNYNEEGVAYSSFASKNLSLTLLNPNNVLHSITSMFGTAGTWKIKVSSTQFTSVNDTLDITVNAIPVETISVTGSSATVEEESTLQLTASVSPNNATNQTVTWSSNHTSIATVNTNGLVTGVSAGEARITATANDGSTVFGFIDITVTKKPKLVVENADMAAGSYANACTVSGNNGVKVGTGNNPSGNMTITVGAGAVKLSFYAAGWSGSGTTISLSGATCGTSQFSISGDSGISGAGNSYTLSGTESNYYHETTLSGITSETTITISGSARFALWKAKYYTVEADPVYPTSISLTADPSTTVAIGGTASISVSYNPGTTNVKNVTFESNHTNIATVSAQGIVTGVAAGSARITATAEAINNTTVTNYIDITVTTVAVSGVSLNKSETSLTVGATDDLIATIAPENATNKNVNWSSDNTSVATVTNAGKVTAVAAGTAIITATSAADSTKKATCTVTVTASGGGSGEQTTTYTFSSKSWAASPANWTSGKDGNMFTDGQGIQVTKGATGANGTSPISFSGVQSVVVGYCTNTSSGAGTITVSVGGTEISQEAVTTTGGTSVREMAFPSNGTLSGNVKITVACGTNSIYIYSCAITTGTPDPVEPTSISISPSTVELAKGGKQNLSVNYNPSNSNTKTEVTWSRFSGSSKIEVSQTGQVTVASDATVGLTAVIRATLTNKTSVYAERTVTVVEQTQDNQTILVYMCGSDLESNGQTNSNNATGLATSDIKEILSVSGQPSDVNIVFETGGAKCWKSTYGINKNYLERYHVSNKALVRDSQETKDNMGKTSTLQSFLTWGVQTYPADRIGLILWNHGGAMRGVCYDETEKVNGVKDCLTNNEVKTAVANTFTSLGRSASNKFEWIGYDACLMQVQDIAEFNSQYFNYMVGSEESEAGEGWDYDKWIDDAYSKKSTPTILTEICDTFLSERGASSDQTLSWLDLSYMSAYKSAWETMSSSLYSLINSYGKSNFHTFMKTVKAYGDTAYEEEYMDYYANEYGYDTGDEFIEAYALEHVGNYYMDYGWYYYGIFDAKDLLNKLKAKNQFSNASTQIQNAINAFGNLVQYSRAGTKAGNSYGLCCFFPLNNGAFSCNKETYYTNTTTNFTNWKSIVNQFGG